MKRRFIIGICLAVLIIFLLIFLKIIKNDQLGPSIVSPIGSGTEPQLIEKPIEISAWLPWWEKQRGLTSLENSSTVLKYLSPCWYKLDKEGKVVVTDISSKKEIFKIASSPGIMIVPTIGNDFDPLRVSKFLSDNDLKNEAIKILINTALDNNYRGWDLDWEQISVSDKDSFSNFVQELHEKLTENNLLLFITVHAQTGEKDWMGALGQDWVALGKFSDALRIMAYDYHHSNSDPGPVTPINELEKTLKYALELISKEKIVLGLPTYGYDWTGNTGKSFQYLDMLEVLKKNKASFSRDEKSSALEGIYTDGLGTKHVVWFEDATSLLKKIEIASSYGIHKFCLWSLGGEDPEIWENYFQ